MRCSELVEPPLNSKNDSLQGKVILQLFKKRRMKTLISEWKSLQEDILMNLLRYSMKNLENLKWNDLNSIVEKF
jgi:hypothetical protein